MEQTCLSIESDGGFRVPAPLLAELGRLVNDDVRLERRGNAIVIVRDDADIAPAAG